jgi:hypothetical protein
MTVRTRESIIGGGNATAICVIVMRTNNRDSFMINYNLARKKYQLRIDTQ